MSETQTETQDTVNEAIQQYHSRRRRQFIGLFAGIGLGMMISSAVPAIRENVDLGVVILWSGVAGVIVTAIDQFEVAGAALTRSENKALNYAVGLGVPLAILALIQLFVLN
jgi:hypothetical protein